MSKEGQPNRRPSTDKEIMTIVGRFFNQQEIEDFNRTDHVPEDVLQEYLEGFLAHKEDELKKAEHHLASCGYCFGLIHLALKMEETNSILISLDQLADAELADDSSFPQ